MMRLTHEYCDDSTGLFLDLCAPDGPITIVYRLGDRDVAQASLKDLVGGFVQDCLTGDDGLAPEDHAVLALMAQQLEDSALHLRSLAREPAP